MSADTHPWTLYNHFITALCLRKKPLCWQTAHDNDKIIKMPTDRFYKLGYVLPHGHCCICDWPQPAQPITFLDSTQSPGMPCACRLQILWKCNFFLQPLFKIWNQLSKCLHSPQPSVHLGEHQLSHWWPGPLPSGSGAVTLPGCHLIPSSLSPAWFQDQLWHPQHPTASGHCCQEREVVKIVRSVCLTRGHK